MADLFLRPYLRSVWTTLHYRLVGERMALFGAGAHTRWLLDTVRDLPPVNVAFILDDAAREGQELQGISVLRPDRVRVDSLGLVLISSDQWEDQIADRCQALWGGEVEVVRLYDGLPTGPYDKSDDRIEALSAVRRTSARRTHQGHEIVLVADEPRSREAKLGYALQSLGWRTILLHRRPATFDVSTYFATSARYGSPWEALRLACDHAPAAYHLMVNSNYRLAETFLRHRPGPVVVDSYDLITGMYTSPFLEARPAYVAELERERWCLEQADGVVSRSAEAQWLKDHQGFSLRRLLHLGDGCWNRPARDAKRGDVERPSPRRRGTVETLNVVYAGKVEVESVEAPPFSGSGHKLWLARLFAEQGIHFHLYPSAEYPAAEFDRVFGAYRELERNTPYVHVHLPVTADGLIETLSRYDLAVFVYNEYATPRRESWTHSEAKLRTASSNKIFDFIDAGLPIAHNARSDGFIGGLLNEHGVGIDLSETPTSEWGTFLRSVDRSALRRKVEKARAVLDIGRLARNLVAFYEQLQDGVMNPRSRSGLETAVC